MEVRSPSTQTLYWLLAFYFALMSSGKSRHEAIRRRHSYSIVSPVIANICTAWFFRLTQVWSVLGTGLDKEC